MEKMIDKLSEPTLETQAQVVADAVEGIVEPKPETEPAEVEAIPPATKPKKQRRASKSAEGSQEAPVATEPKPEPKSSRSKKPALKTPGKGTTLEDLAAAYVAAIENDGASTSTVTGYRAELGRALKVFGAETLLADLTEDAVKRYFKSKHVTMKRDGQRRDVKTIDRTRRVLRLALAWAEERGIVEKAPIPEKI